MESTEELIKSLRREIINFVSKEIEDKKERTNTLVELCLRFKHLSEGKSPSFPELTPMIKRVNRITTFVNSKIGNIQGIEREKFFKELSRSIFAFLGALSVHKPKTAYQDLHNIIGIFTKLATKTEWEKLIEKLESNPELKSKYLERHKTHQKNYIQRKLETDPKNFLLNLHNKQVEEAKKKREEIASESLKGLMILLRQQLANKKQDIKKSLNDKKMEEFLQNVKIINEFRENVNDYLGVFYDSDKKPAEDKIKSILESGSKASDAALAYSAIQITILKIIQKIKLAIK